MGVRSARRYPPDPAIVASVRSFAAGRLNTLQLSQLRDDVELLLTELITNVIIHARTEFDIRVEASGAGVRVEVIDANLSAAPPHGDHVSGRGVPRSSFPVLPHAG